MTNASDRRYGVAVKMQVSGRHRSLRRYAVCSEQEKCTEAAQRHHRAPGVNIASLCEREQSQRLMRKRERESTQAFLVRFERP